jgi:DNA-directed RNA polymerase subunit L
MDQTISKMASESKEDMPLVSAGAGAGAGAGAAGGAGPIVTGGEKTPMFIDYMEPDDSPTLLTSKEHRIAAKFRLTPSTTIVANTLRRQILVSTKSVGFQTEPAETSDVKVIKNTTPLANEILMHRIGMIPIAADPDTFDPERYEFRIDVENKGKTMIDITASDFVVIEKDPTDAADTGRVVPTNLFFPVDPITKESCIITRLRPQWNASAPNEHLIVVAKASIDIGKSNIRFSPVSQCSPENTPDNNPERQKAAFEKWAMTHKKMRIGEVAGDIALALRREFDTMEIQRVFKVNEIGEPNDFTFYIESVGIQSVPTIVKNGIQSCADLVKKYQEIDVSIPSNVTIRKGNTRFTSIEFVFRDETHTLGNLLQTYLVNNHIEGSQEPRIAFAGYKIPHPLRPEMVLTIAIDPSASDEGAYETHKASARYAVAQVCRYLVSFFNQMNSDWERKVMVTKGKVAAVETKTDE